MKWTPAWLVLVLPIAAGAERPEPRFPSPGTQPQVQTPRGQVPALGRPTRTDDPMPLLDVERYFVGTWTFEWDVPDSVLGTGGRIAGTETFKPGIDGRFFESGYRAEGPDGPFTGRRVMIYHAEQKVMARHETDSRGFSRLESGTIGGDLGGYFTIYYESAPFTYKDRVLRTRMTTQLLSPVHFKVRAQLSVDGGPFQSYGNPWWRKEDAGLVSR